MTWSLAFLAPLLASCGGDGGGTPVPPALPGPVSVRCSSTLPGTDRVGLTCGAAESRTDQVVNVVIGGPTGSADIQSILFDVVYDATHVEYVEGSAEQGTLLSQDGDDPMLLAELFDGVQGRLVVGISRTNRPAGVRGDAAQNLVMRLTFRAKGSRGFLARPLLFENAEVLDSTGAVIPGLAFENSLTLRFHR